METTDGRHRAHHVARRGTVMSWRRRQARERDLERELRSDLDLEGEEQQGNGLSAQEPATPRGGRLAIRPLLERRCAKCGAPKLGTGWLRTGGRRRARFIRARDSRWPPRSLWLLAFAPIRPCLPSSMPSFCDRCHFPNPGRLIRIDKDVVRQQASLVILRDNSRTTEYGAYSAETGIQPDRPGRAAAPVGNPGIRQSVFHPRAKTSAGPDL